MTQELERSSEAETAPGVNSSGSGGAESDGEGADLQVRISWEIQPACLVACLSQRSSAGTIRCKTVFCVHKGCADVC